MSGIIGLGRRSLGEAKAGFSKMAQLENNRNTMNEQLRQAESAETKSLSATGASIGATAGASAAAGVAGANVAMSALATGGVGLLAGYLISEWL